MCKEGKGWFVYMFVNKVKDWRCKWIFIGLVYTLLVFLYIIFIIIFFGDGHLNKC